MAKANIGALRWVTEKLIDLGDCRIEVAIGQELFDLQSTDDHFVLGKGRPMIDALVAELGDADVRRMVDVGIFKGGSVVLFDRLFAPEKLVAVDLKRTTPPALTRYIERKGPDRIRIYGGVNQADHEALDRICKDELGEHPLDLVVDDASHFCFETRETFRALFPRLRPRGLYVIEDWGWSHWQSELWKTPYFEGKTPMTHLLIELAVACASSPRAITKVSFNNNQIFVRRGPELLAPGFDLSSLCRNLQAALPIRTEGRQ
jgi:hypothetical protein